MQIKSRLLYLIILIFLFSFMRCNLEQSSKQKELELKEKELELIEKELKIKESKSLIDSQYIENSELKNRNKERKHSKELRFLYASNAGIVGYFDNGTVVVCPKCDFCRSNILTMFNENPSGIYEINNDGSLQVNHSEREYPNYNEDKGWVLINYKWNEKVPQF